METNVKENRRSESFSNLNQKDTLLIAIGNSARSDDGLGWAFLDQLKHLNNFEGETSYCYQLQIEDAETISHYPRVIFVDASEETLKNGFAWEKTEALNDFTFTTHTLSPEAVLFLCNDLYKKFPEAYTVKIQGHKWKLKKGLSETAQNNLLAAFQFFNKMIAPVEYNKKKPVY